MHAVSETTKYNYTIIPPTSIRNFLTFKMGYYNKIVTHFNLVDTYFAVYSDFVFLSSQKKVIRKILR